MILTRSPYTITPSKTVSTTEVIGMQLYCWTMGTNRPASYEYYISKVLPPREIEFEVSNLIKDFYQHTPIYYSTTGVRKSLLGNVVAVDAFLTYLSPVNTENILGQFALDGYGEFKEGSNPTTPANGVLLANDYYLVNASGFFNIPVLKTAGQIKINGVNKSYQTGTEVSSQVQNIWLNLAEFNNDITVEVGTHKIYLELQTECKYEPKEVMFLNRFGCWEVMTFFKKSVESIKTESKEFKPYSRIYERYNTNARTSLEFNSGFVPEWYNETIKQLLLSEHVYLLEDGKHIPLNVETSSYEFKTRKADKLISHNIKFIHAFDLI